MGKTQGMDLEKVHEDLLAQVWGYRDRLAAAEIELENATRKLEHFEQEYNKFREPKNG